MVNAVDLFESAAGKNAVGIEPVEAEEGCWDGVGGGHGDALLGGYLKLGNFRLKSFGFESLGGRMNIIWDFRTDWMI